jgi:hypothetical protein
VRYKDGDLFNYTRWNIGTDSGKDGRIERWRGYIPFRPILSFAMTSIILELRGLCVSTALGSIPR